MKILIDGQTFETPEIHRGIGVYLKNTLNQMIKISYEHDWYLVVSDTRNLGELDPWVRTRLHVVLAEEFKPGSDYNRNNVYTDKLQNIIDQYRIDAVWIPNGLMVNVLFLSYRLSCPVYITIYDLIPTIFPVKEWPRYITEEYKRRLKMLRDEQDIRLIMISKSTLSDWKKYMNDNERMCTVTPLSADAKVFYRKRYKGGNNELYILFTGGFDYRKNIDGAIDAFSRVRKTHINDADFLKYKLKIVGKYDDATKAKYDRIILSKNLVGQVELIGYVSEEKLVELYQHADLFFFPSLYEGFGLPILEAMLSGDYVVCADNSSLPEVCGGHATLFDVNHPEEMAEALYNGYCTFKNEKQEDIEHRQKYALGFSWDLTAKKTLESIERGCISNNNKDSRPSLAIFTPWPNQKTGIANYEYKLIPYLQKYFNITVFTTASERYSEDLGLEVYSLKAYTSKKALYDYKLFEIGNNALFHKEIFELMEQEGGIAEIHDYVLTPFFYAAYGKDKKRFEKLLITGYGYDKGMAFSELTRRLHNHPEIRECPMAETVVNISDKTLFHNHWSCDMIGENKTFTVPHPSFSMAKPNQTIQKEKEEKFRKQFKINESDIIISCFGWVNTNKRPSILVGATKILLQKGYQVKLIFWGKNDVDSLPERISDEKLGDIIFISGYLSAEEYYTAMDMTDIVVNLRYPSMGESSGTLCEAFQMAKPTIVSDIDQYREYPDETCWKLPVCTCEEELLSKYIAYLIDHTDVREALGNNAKEYAEYALNPERIAKLYYQYITQRELT